MTIQTLTLHADAPPKPALGQPCNGCGMCCAAERCPMAWLFLPLRSAPCAALEWDGEARCYRCGMVENPAKYIGWLPRRWEARASRWFGYRVAAGKGCDFGAVEI
jgi:hypothetical protein